VIDGRGGEQGERGTEGVLSHGRTKGKKKKRHKKKEFTINQKKQQMNALGVDLKMGETKRGRGGVKILFKRKKKPPRLGGREKGKQRENMQRKYN